MEENVTTYGLSIEGKSIFKSDVTISGQLIADNANLSNYYTKEETNELIDGVTGGDVELANYYTKTEIDNKGFLTSSDKTELNSQITTATSTSKVSLTSGTPTSGILKTYIIKQGTAEIGKIDIPKDLVVTSGEVITAVNESGLTIGNKYIKLIIANQTTPLYIDVKDLVDVYTGGDYITIGDDNTISVNYTDLQANFDEKYLSLNGGTVNGDTVIKSSDNNLIDISHLIGVNIQSTQTDTYEDGQIILNANDATEIFMGAVNVENINGDTVKVYTIDTIAERVTTKGKNINLQTVDHRYDVEVLNQIKGESSIDIAFDKISLTSILTETDDSNNETQIDGEIELNGNVVLNGKMSAINGDTTITGATTINGDTTINSSNITAINGLKTKLYNYYVEIGPSGDRDNLAAYFITPSSANTLTNNIIGFNGDTTITGTATINGDTTITGTTTINGVDDNTIRLTTHDEESSIELNFASGSNNILITSDNINLGGTTTITGKTTLITTPGKNTALTITEDNQNSINLYADEIQLDSNVTVSGEFTAPSIAQISDMMLKTVIDDVNIDIDKINQAPLFRYKFNESDTKHIGTSAQYWKEVLPELVYGEEGNYSLEYSVLGVALAIQLSREIKMLKDKNEQLVKDIEILKSK